MINFCPPGTPITAWRVLKNVLQSRRVYQSSGRRFFYSPGCDRALSRYLRSPRQPSGPGTGRPDRRADRLRPGQHLRPAAGPPAARPGRGGLPSRLRRQAVRQGRRPARTDRLPGLPAARRHPGRAEPGPAIPVAGRPDRNRWHAASAWGRVQEPARGAGHHHSRRAAGLPRLRRAGRVHPRADHRGHPRGTRRRPRPRRAPGAPAGHDRGADPPRRPQAAPGRAHPQRPAGLARLPACHLARHRQPACPGLAHHRPGHQAGFPDYLDKHQPRGISLERIRPDRILQEALATGADPLHLALVFNIDHTNAMAYASAARNLLSSSAE